MIDETPILTVAEAIEQALKLMDRARFLKVIATGQTLAEIEGEEWDFWALGPTPYGARLELTKVIAQKLLKRAGSLPEEAWA